MRQSADQDYMVLLFVQTIFNRKNEHHFHNFSGPRRSQTLASLAITSTLPLTISSCLLYYVVLPTTDTGHGLQSTCRSPIWTIGQCFPDIPCSFFLCGLQRGLTAQRAKFITREMVKHQQQRETHLGRPRFGCSGLARPLLTAATMTSHQMYFPAMLVVIFTSKPCL